MTFPKSHPERPFLAQYSSLAACVARLLAWIRTAPPNPQKSLSSLLLLLDSYYRCLKQGLELLKSLLERRRASLMICSKLHTPVTDASDANTVEVDTVEVWGAQTHVDSLFSPPAFFSLRNTNFPRKARPLLSH